MSESWYLQDKGKSLFSGLESEFNSELDTVFREMALAADNGYDIVINRLGVADVTTRVIIQSSTQSKHGEKTILFSKAIIRIGDIINYGVNKYLLSSWVNEDISMNDSAPMHLCNAEISYDIVTETPTGGKDEMGRPTFTTDTVTVAIPSVFDTMRFFADSDSIINLELDTIECWVQYSDALMESINTQVRVHGKYYTIEGISRDMLVLSDSNYHGVLRLKLRTKE